jgi:hypothetical protein
MPFTLIGFGIFYVNFHFWNFIELLFLVYSLFYPNIRSFSILIFWKQPDYDKPQLPKDDEKDIIRDARSIVVVKN